MARSLQGLRAVRYAPPTMATLTPVSLGEARALGEPFGLDVVELEPLAAGSVNTNVRVDCADGTRWFLRVFEEQDQAGALREHRLLAHLARAELPVAEPVRTSAGATLAEHCGKPAAFYPWLVGEIRCQASVRPEDTERLGATLARVHALSGGLPSPGAGRFGPAELRARLDRVEREASPRYGADVARLRAALPRVLARRDATLPVGVIHGDLFRDNVLWRGDTLTALLDFESACEAPFAYDLAVTLLAWCFGNAFELELVRALLRGYERERPLTAAERAGLAAEAAFACLRFATTRLTDFALRTPEGESPARDYRRFLRRLDALEAGVLDDAFRGGA